MSSSCAPIRVRASRYPTWAPNFFYTQLCAENRISGKGWVAPTVSATERLTLATTRLRCAFMPEIMFDRIKWLSLIGCRVGRSRGLRTTSSSNRTAR